MKSNALYDQAHLWVAGIRVYEHLHNKPPSINEMADFLKISPEVSTLISKKLGDLGVIGIIKAEFEERLYVQDYAKIEELPRDIAPNGMEKEIEKFRQQQTSRLDEIAKKLESGKENKKVFSDLDKALKDPSGVLKKKNPLDDF
jgi:DNA-binding transcriptional regulator YhcF (GntR family)